MSGDGDGTESRNSVTVLACNTVTDGLDLSSLLSCLFKIESLKLFSPVVHPGLKYTIGAKCLSSVLTFLRFMKEEHDRPAHQADYSYFSLPVSRPQQLSIMVVDVRPIIVRE